MSAAVGYIELDRTVESIQVGHRHRKDMGDLDALISSIERDGLLQPITITPDGVLVCGARRLAAVRRLGWRTQWTVWLSLRAHGAWVPNNPVATLPADEKFHPVHISLFGPQAIVFVAQDLAQLV